MNIFCKVTLESLKKNRTRTAVTVIGVILSASMICAVTTLVSSARDCLVRGAVYNEGDWHGQVTDTSFGTYGQISDSRKIESAIWFQQLGYAPIQGVENDRKPYIYLLGSGEGAENLLPIHILSGRYPISPDEIVLPEHLYTDGAVSYSVGDTLTLTLGERMLDGVRLNQRTSFHKKTENTDGAQDIGGEQEGETLKIQETRTYTVVGFYKRLGYSIEGYFAPGYTAFTVADEVPPENGTYDVYFRMKNPKEIREFMEEKNLNGYSNTELLRYSGVFQYSTFEKTLYSLAGIVIGLIMFGSVSLIYNAFSISVSERTKLFGLLSSVGATKRQLKDMVLFEALVVSAVGIPTGILCGIGGIGITLLFVGRKFVDMGLFSVEMKLSVSPLSIAAAAFVALITVLISARIPSKRATQFSAVEAIRENRDIRVGRNSRRNAKYYGWSCGFFGFPGALARKYYKRSRKKYRATVLSLFMSVVLFVSTSSFSDYLSEAMDGGSSVGAYDLFFERAGEFFSDSSPEELLELLKREQSVTGVAFEQRIYVSGQTDSRYLDKDYLVKLESEEGSPRGEEVQNDRTTEGYAVSLPIMVCFIDNGEFQKLLDQNHLDSSLFTDRNKPLAVAIDRTRYFNENTERYEQLNFLSSDDFEFCALFHKIVRGYTYFGEFEDGEGNRICRYAQYGEGGEGVPERYLDLPYEEATERYLLKSGKTVYDKPFFYDGYTGLTLIYPQSVKTAVFPEERFEDSSYRYFLTSRNHNESYDAVRDILLQNGYGGQYIIDYAATVEQDRNTVTLIRVFTYGFVVLISLVAVANVFNTVTTNINLRRRELAMLKSVGMGRKELYGMMRFECILYGSRALLWGLPVSAFVSYLIHRAVGNGFDTGFRLPVGAMGAAAVGVFLVVFGSMLFAVSKIKKDNPIDALKNENL